MRYKVSRSNVMFIVKLSGILRVLSGKPAMFDPTHWSAQCWDRMSTGAEPVSRQRRDAPRARVYRRRTSPAKSRSYARRWGRHELALRDRDQPILRGVLHVEQLDQGLGGSITSRYDLAKQSGSFAMILAA